MCQFENGSLEKGTFGRVDSIRLSLWRLTNWAMRNLTPHQHFYIDWIEHYLFWAFGFIKKILECHFRHNKFFFVFHLPRLSNIKFLGGRIEMSFARTVFICTWAQFWSRGIFPPHNWNCLRVAATLGENWEMQTHKSFLTSSQAPPFILAVADLEELCQCI